MLRMVVATPVPYRRAIASTLSCVRSRRLATAGVTSPRLTWPCRSRHLLRSHEALSVMHASSSPSLWDNVHSQHRALASYSGRGKPTRTRVRTREDEADESQTRNAALSQRLEQAPVHARETDKSRTVDSLHDAGLQNFMIKIYSTTGGCIGMAAVGSALPMLGIVPMLNPWIPGIGMIGTYFYLQMKTDSTTNPTTRTALLGTCAALGGMSLTPAMLMYSAADPTIVPVAFALTCLLFAGSTAAALMMPKRSMMKFAPVLGGGACVMLGVVALSIFWPHPALFNIWLYGGLVLATAFVAYDTQSAIQGYEDGERDHVQYSLDFFMNFLALFRRMLALLGMGSRDS